MMAIPHPLVASANARPEHIAVASTVESVNYETLRDRVARRAGELQAGGLLAGQTVLVFADTSIDWIVTLLAVGWCDAVVAILPSGLKAREVESRVRGIRSDWFLGDPVDEITTPTLARGAARHASAPEWDLNADRFIIWTSGSTGVPTPVCLKTGQLIFSALGSAIRLGHDPADRWLACLPFAHVGGLSIIMRSIIYGTTMIVHERFNARSVTSALQDGSISQVSLVPNMLARVVDILATECIHKSVRFILVGGGPVDERLVAECNARKLPVCLTWGMSEAASQVCTTFPGDTLTPGVVGPPLQFSTVHVNKGRLWVSGATALGELETSDIGHLLPSGEIRVVGRADDVIISGGHKLDAVELRQLIEQDPNVKEAVVVGRDDVQWGQRPVAFVVPRIKPFDVNAAKTQLSELMTSYKVPRSWVICDALPRNLMGKVQRTALRDWLAGIVDEPDGFERTVNFQSAVAGPHLNQVHEGVLEAHGRSHLTAVAHDLVTARHRPVGEPLHRQADRQTVTVSDHAVERGLGVHQRKPDAPGVVAPGGVPESSSEHFLKTDMRVLKDAVKEQNSSSIHLVKTSGDDDLERQRPTLQKGKTSDE